jgi:hypothetical protein
LSPPRIVAVLDVSNEVEREVRDAIQRFHTGRWPLFRCYALRRAGSVIYEVAQWNPKLTGHGPRLFSLVEWNLSARAMCWRYFPTLAAAREALADVIGNVAPMGSAAPAAANTAP